MISSTLSPYTSVIDELLTACFHYLEPSTSTIEPGTITPASKLWIAFYRVPLGIIGNAISFNSAPVETEPDQATEADNEQAPSLKPATEQQPEQTIEPTEPPNPQHEQQPQESAVVEVPATEETTDPVCPKDAEQHNDGKFRLSREHHGWKVERWKNSKKGEKYSVHYIPHGDRCDCKASEIYGNCCHQKALDRELMRQKFERDRIQTEALKSIYYRVVLDGEILKASQYLTHCENRFNEHCKWGKIQESIRIEKVQGETITTICEFNPTPETQLTLPNTEPAEAPGLAPEIKRELDNRDELFNQVSRLQWSVDQQKSFARELFGTDTGLSLDQRVEMVAAMKKIKTPPKPEKPQPTEKVEKAIAALASLRNPPPF